MSFFISFLLFSFLCSLRGFNDDDDDDDDDAGGMDDAGAGVSEAWSDGVRDEEVGCHRGRLTGMG